MAKHKENSQISLVLKHLQRNKEITPLEALKMYGCYRLGAVIFNLKAEGYNIKTHKAEVEKSNGKIGRYAVYKLEV